MENKYLKIEWKDCIDEPSEIGKKVLCERRGDLYVAVRYEEYYIPMPFVDHYYSKDLSKPQKWCELPFPDHLTGYESLYITETKELIKLSEAKKRNLLIYWKIAKGLISNIASIPMPESIKKHYNKN